MLLYVARPTKLVEARLVWRDQLREVCIPLMGQPVIGVVFLSPSARPVVRPVARFVILVRLLSSAPSLVLSFSSVFCPSVPSRRVPSALSSSSVCSVRPSARAAFALWSTRSYVSLR
jgi:hypothetical protein